MKIENNTIRRAVKQFGTPLYLYCGSEIRSAYNALREKAPYEMDIFFSMKANPLLGIARILQQEGACCEVCSEIELQVALKSGFSPTDIIFVGPGKSNKELELCIVSKIYAVVCESLDDLIRLNNIANRYNYKCPVLLRINPDFVTNNAPLKMGGKATQFGIDLSQMKMIFRKILNLSNIHIRGIHVYNGTRILDANTIVTNTLNILKLADSLSEEWSVKFECIDIGGGFGIPYFEGEQALDIVEIFKGLNPIINSYINKYANTRIILECGRYLVGTAGILISRILSIKTSHGENFVISDGGMNCHMAATGIGSFVRRNFPIELISSREKHNKEPRFYNVTGPLCTPGDLLARQVKLPRVDISDLIIIKNSGAYGSTASPGRFLSHGFPAEALFDNGELTLLRRKENINDILNTQTDFRPVTHYRRNFQCKTLTI